VYELVSGKRGQEEVVGYAQDWASTQQLATKEDRDYPDTENEPTPATTTTEQPEAQPEPALEDIPAEVYEPVDPDANMPEDWEKICLFREQNPDKKLIVISRDEKYLERFREAMQFFYKKHFKKSWFFDKFLQIGSLLYAIFKQKQAQKLKNEIDKYIVFSKNKIQLNLNRPIEYLTDFEQFKNTKNVNFELIFDTNSFSFAEIIYFMEKHKSKNITFKNYISQSNYLIGSNNSTDRGEVLIF
jgi:hypothetical protein